MAAYRRVYDSRHLQADCQEPGSAPEPYNMLVLYCFCVAAEFLVNKDSYNRVWATFLHRKWHVVLKDASDFLL